MLDPGTSSNDPGDDFFEDARGWESRSSNRASSSCRFRTIHQCLRGSSFMERLVAFALEREVIICHDFAYADLGFDGYVRPRSCKCAREGVLRGALTLTSRFDGRLAGGFVVGNPGSWRRSPN